MSSQEGVIKYQLEHSFAPLPSTLSIHEINAWRNIMFRLNLIGQQDERYDGYGFGNISQRTTDDSFIISGTQTGHLEMLEKKHYCLVSHADPEKNHIISTGETKPSSEALTHASVYAQDTHIKAVIHVHCPEIWHKTQLLELPFTPAHIPYGTVEMAKAVSKLFETQIIHQYAVFSLLGHEDGIVACGQSLSQAADILIQKLALALSIE